MPLTDDKLWLDSDDMFFTVIDRGFRLNDGIIKPTLYLGELREESVTVPSELGFESVELRGFEDRMALDTTQLATDS